MPEDTTPKIRTIFDFFGRKRGHPSTGSGSSEGGTISKQQKSAKLDISAATDMSDLKKDLNMEFNAGSDSEEEREILDTFDKSMEHYFREFKRKMQDQLKQAVAKMSERVNSLEKRVIELEKENKQHEDVIMNLKQEQNRQTQYQKKVHLKMLGVEEKREEDCRKTVCDVISKKLKIQIQKFQHWA